MVVDTLLTTDLDVVGTANVNNLFVSGITSIPGGVIDLADIICDSIEVQGNALINTLNVTSTSTLAGVTATAIAATNITATGTVATTNLNSTTSSTGATTTTTLNSTTVSASSVSSAGAVTGGSLVTVGSISGGSMTLGAPLPESSGGTGQTSLVLVTVGNATTAGSATLAGTSTTVSGGGTGTVLVQTSPGITGFITTQTAGTVLTSNGVNTLPSFQTPGVGSVTGVLPVANGGTGVTTSTGTGSVVLNTSPALVTPDIGVASGTSLEVTGITESVSYTTGTIICHGGIGITGNVISNANITAALNVTGGGFTSPNGNFGAINGKFISLFNSENATGPSTGAIQAQSGGISCATDLWAGGAITSNTTQNATSASTGAVRIPTGGLGCASDIWGGARVTANSSTATVGPGTGAITTPGGIDCTTFYCPAISGVTSINNSPFVYLQGVWTPELTAILPSDDAAFLVDINTTYIKQNGFYVAIGNMYIISCDIEFTQSNNANTIGVAIENIPGVSFTKGPSGTYGLDTYMEPATPGGIEDNAPAFSLYNATTNRWEQLVGIVPLVPIASSLVPYLYVNGNGPAIGTYKINWTAVAHKV